ncbi:C-type lectin domain family 4 member F-like isoform X1 [Ambystoma mexicanum]|uniref:C-type lectin domain family 4 member F-like isoform X1 n=1 Tax=Ambystoma mexicanum TaxID=8296 RepID=UPI0037E7BC26
MRSKVAYVNELPLPPPVRGLQRYEDPQPIRHMKVTRRLAIVSIILSILMSISLVAMIVLYFQKMLYLKVVDYNAKRLLSSLKAEITVNTTELDPAGFQILTNLAKIQAAVQQIQACGRDKDPRPKRNCTNTPTDGWRENGNFLYYFSQQVKNWNDAEKFCVSQNSHLTSITSPEEQGYLATMRGTAYYWIGLTDQASEGTWYFVDGSPYKLRTLWAPNQPDNWLTPQGERENCAKIYRDDLWNDIVCSVELRWICKKSCMLK